MEAKGIALDVDKISIESIAEQWGAINDMAGASAYANAMEAAAGPFKLATS